MSLFPSEPLAARPEPRQIRQNVTMSTNYINVTVQESNQVDVTTVYVVSLQGVLGVHAANSARFEDFLKAWSMRCDFSYKLCPGVKDTDVKPGVMNKSRQNRGYGITQAFINCFETSLHSNDSLSIFLEDDARLGDTQSCDIMSRDALWKSRPSDTLLVLLGGHNWKFKNADIVNNRFRLSLGSFGCYGFAVSRDKIKTLRQWFERDISEGLRRNQSHLSPDTSWYKLAKGTKQRIYAVWPNVVFHSVGYSNTWGEYRKRIRP